MLEIGAGGGPEVAQVRRAPEALSRATIAQIRQRQGEIAVRESAGGSVISALPGPIRFIFRNPRTEKDPTASFRFQQIGTR